MVSGRIVQDTHSKFGKLILYVSIGCPTDSGGNREMDMDFKIFHAVAPRDIKKIHLDILFSL